MYIPDTQVSRQIFSRLYRLSIFVDRKATNYIQAL